MYANQVFDNLPSSNTDTGNAMKVFDGLPQPARSVNSVHFTRISACNGNNHGDIGLVDDKGVKSYGNKVVNLIAESKVHDQIIEAASYVFGTHAAYLVTKQTKGVGSDVFCASSNNNGAYLDCMSLGSHGSLYLENPDQLSTHDFVYLDEQLEACIAGNKSKKGQFSSRPLEQWHLFDEMQATSESARSSKHLCQCLG